MASINVKFSSTSTDDPRSILPSKSHLFSFTSSSAYISHLLESCAILAEYICLEIDISGEKLTLPAYICEYDLGEFIGTQLPWFSRYSARPGGLWVRTLFLGTPFDQPFNVGTDIIFKLWNRSLLDDFADALVAPAQEYGCSGVLVSGLPLTKHGSAPKRWFLRADLPETVIPLGFSSREEFIQGLGPNSRSNFRRRLRRIEEDDIKIAIMLPEAATLEKIYPCYQKTYDRAQLKWLRMPPNYFTLCPWLQEKGKLFVACRQDTLLGFALMVSHNHFYINHRMGLSYMRENTVNEYFALLFATLDYAIENHYQDMLLGPTTYDTKLRLGANLLHRQGLGYYFNSDLHHLLSFTMQAASEQLLANIRSW